MAYSNTVALCDSSGEQFCGHVRTRDFAVDYEMSSEELSEDYRMKCGLTKY